MGRHKKNKGRLIVVGRGKGGGLVQLRGAGVSGGGYGGGCGGGFHGYGGKGTTWGNGAEKWELVQGKGWVRVGGGKKVDVEPVRVEVEMEKIGIKGVMREDGRIWRQVEVWGGRFEVPMSREEVAMGIVGGKEWKDRGELRGQMMEEPGAVWRVPVGILKGWVAVLLTRPGEAGCLYGKRGREWVAVVPPQKASGGECDMDKLDEVAVWMMTNKVTRVGTIHTHPGGMTSYSGTDEHDLFSKVGGIHYIVPRDGRMGCYVSVGGNVWEIPGWSHKGESMWKGEQKEVKWEDIGMRGIGGEVITEEMMDKLVKKPSYPVMGYLGSGYNPGVGDRAGYDYYEENDIVGVGRGNTTEGSCNQVGVQKGVGRNYWTGYMWVDQQEYDRRIALWKSSCRVKRQLFQVMDGGQWIGVGVVDVEGVGEDIGSLKQHKKNRWNSRKKRNEWWSDARNVWLTWDETTGKIIEVEKEEEGESKKAVVAEPTGEKEKGTEGVFESLGRVADNVIRVSDTLERKLRERYGGNMLLLWEIERIREWGEELKKSTGNCAELYKKEKSKVERSVDRD